MAKKKTVKKNKKRACRGFTLIELLVVIAIIGILATIVMVSLNTARQKARDSRRISDARQVQTAAQMYYDTSGQYPATLDAMVPTYLTTKPVDPGSNVYTYAVCGTGNSEYVFKVVQESGTATASTGTFCTTVVCGAAPDYCVRP